jgi:hypothetical protein
MTTGPDDGPLDADHPDVQALGHRGRALVLDVVSDLAADDLEPDPVERVLLLEAARHLDLCARLEDALTEADVVVVGSQGQPRPNPLLDSLDKTRRTVAQLLARVTRGDRTEAARSAAKARARAGSSVRLGAA